MGVAAAHAVDTTVAVEQAAAAGTSADCDTAGYSWHLSVENLHPA